MERALFVQKVYIAASPVGARDARSRTRWIRRGGWFLFVAAMACWRVDVRGVPIPQGYPQAWNNLKIKYMFPLLEQELSGRSRKEQENQLYYWLNAIHACFNDKDFNYISYSRTIVKPGQLFNKKGTFSYGQTWLHGYWQARPLFLQDWYARGSALLPFSSLWELSSSLSGLVTLGW